MRRALLLLAVASVTSIACLVPVAEGDAGSGGGTGGGAGGATGGSGGHVGGGTGGSPAGDGGCVVTESSTLPHVRLVVSPAACSISTSDPAPTLVIRYQLVVDQPVPGFVPGAPYPAGQEVANLVVDEQIAGQGQRYCLCDQGLSPSRCPLPDGGFAFTGPCGPITLPAGTFARSFSWNGRNWNGPSDTNNPYGPPFPVGDYLFTVSTRPGSLGGGTALSATATLTVHVTP